jgi:hypothetical protein
MDTGEAATSMHLHPLSAVATLAGSSLNEDTLLATATQLDTLSKTMGYPSLATFASACRELYEDLQRDKGIN